MFFLEAIKQMNEDAMDVYRKTIPATLRLRNRLRDIGSTTVEQNRAIEALFDLLSPALQNVFIEADVTNEDLVPVTGFAPIWTINFHDPDYVIPDMVFNFPADNSDDALEDFKKQFEVTPDLGFQLDVEPSEPGTGLNYSRPVWSSAPSHPTRRRVPPV